MFVQGTTVFRSGTLIWRNTHFPRIYFPRTSGLARGKHPHSAHLYLARSPHLRRPQGFGNLPISRPGFGKLPTRQSVSSLWSPECLLPNSQLGRVSPYSYEASPPLSRQLQDNFQLGLLTSRTQDRLTTFPCHRRVRHRSGANHPQQYEVARQPRSTYCEL